MFRDVFLAESWKVWVQTLKYSFLFNYHYLRSDSEKSCFDSAGLLTAILLFLLFTAWGRDKDWEQFMVMADKISPLWSLGRGYQSLSFPACEMLLGRTSFSLLLGLQTGLSWVKAKCTICCARLLNANKYWWEGCSRSKAEQAARVGHGSRHLAIGSSDLLWQWREQ